ncbi:MAG: TRAP transporter substrate-binding protein DctP [Hyphomicrobium sp.]
MASPSPEGTAWAREARSFAHDVEQLTRGQVQVKLYLGGIAGDDLEMGERMRRGQLDAAASGGMLCMKLAPSMRALRLFGVFRTQEEVAYINNLLKPIFDGEFQRAGVVDLGEFGLGPSVIFSREPVRSLSDLRRMPLWVWELDEMARRQLEAVGVHVVPAPLDQARQAYDDGRVAGFVAAPAVALAFQWSAQTRYLSDVPLGFLRGCVLVTDRAFQRLTFEQQQGLRTAAATLIARLESVGRTQDDLLLSSLFTRQGLKIVTIVGKERQALLDAVRRASEPVVEKSVPPALLQRVRELLADFRGH